jgi:predicted HicB family RNase H-like nuclease
MLEYRGYLGVVEADDGAFVGRVAGLRDVITFEGDTYAEVEQAFHDSVDDYLAFCDARGEPPDRPYSGKIPLRVDPELHRRAAAQAQAAGVSLNQWIAGRLEQVLVTPRAPTANSPKES